MSDKISFDLDSLQKLVNEAYKDIAEETSLVNKQIKEINEQIEKNPSIGYQQFGEVIVKTVQNKSVINDKKFKIINIVKDVYRMSKTIKDNGEVETLTAEALMEISEQLESLNQK